MNNCASLKIAKNFPSPIASRRKLPTGFHILLQINTKSNFLRLHLHIIDVSCTHFDAHFTSNCSILLAGANKLLLDLNPRSGKADHMLNITRFVTYSSRLLENALVAIRQLNVNQQILGLFTKNERITNEFRQGCVECLESKQVSEFQQQEG
ncbi:hypothetical protein quinque_012521 [Culex quinquefasciatus]